MIEGARYLTANDYFKAQWGCKIRKVSLDLGRTCPNRDGAKGYSGCIFCSETGSGSRNSSFQAKPVLCKKPYNDGSVLPDALNQDSLHDHLRRQINAGLSFYKKRYTYEKFIAYFQAFTPTYGPAQELNDAIGLALAHPQIHGFAVASRADCFTPQVAQILQDQARGLDKNKIFWVELGLQSVHDASLRWMNRQETHSDYRKAQSIADQHNIPVVAHVILGLPDESMPDIKKTADYLNEAGVWGVKIHQLQAVPGSGLWPPNREEPLIQPFTLQKYLDQCIWVLENLHPAIVVHRVAGDYNRRTGIFDQDMDMSKDKVMHALHKEMIARGSFQGRLFGLNS